MPKNEPLMVWMEIAIDGFGPVGRITFELFKKDCPKAAENFRALCTGEKKGKKGPICYKGCSFFRIIPTVLVMSGDVQNNDMSGSETIYGKYFPAEKKSLKMQHGPGILTMSNDGDPKHTSSQFMIMDRPMPQFDGKYAVIGGVVGGEDVCHMIQDWGSMTEEGEPTKCVWISDCGEVNGKTASKKISGAMPPPRKQKKSSSKKSSSRSPGKSSSSRSKSSKSSKSSSKSPRGKKKR